VAPRNVIPNRPTHECNFPNIQHPELETKVNAKTHFRTASALTAETIELGRVQQFDDLIADKLGDLYRFAYWLSGNRWIAEDLMQETLFRVWKRRGQLKDSKAVKGWLLTIARRENARRFERKQLKETDVPIEGLISARCEYDTSTEVFALWRALARLPLKYREPLLMQVIHGYSLEEIAKKLGISRAGAGTRLFRAREKMRALL
jgi:RNA polymerase sigma-70 factor (ECF subfamily)